MTWFDRSKPKSPFFDFVMKTTPEAAARFADNHPKNDQHLGVLIGMMVFSSISNLANPGKELAKDIKIHPDVLAFEAAFFSIYLIRLCQEPSPPEDCDEEDWYEEHFDEFMDSAWKYAYAFIVQIADSSGGWDTEAIMQRRLLRYMHLKDVRRVTEDFIATLEETQGATAPMAKYPGPISLDLKQHTALLAVVMSFVQAIPPAYARMLTQALQLVDWRADFVGTS
jgi:hypothetical protein